MQNGLDKGAALQQKTDLRLECEVSKLQAEVDKLNAETVRIKRDLNPIFFSKDFVLKSILVVILFGPLVWFYFHEIFLPIMQKENIKLELQNAKTIKEIHDARVELEVQKTRHEEQVNQLQKQKKEVESKLAALEKTGKELSNEHQKLEAEFNALAHQMEQTETDKAAVKSKMNEISRRLEQNQRQVSILGKFYTAYYNIKSRSYLYIEPVFSYEGKADLASNQESYIRLMPGLLKQEFKIDPSTIVALIEKEEEYLVDEGLYKNLSEEERKTFFRKADYKVTGAILEFKGNSILARFEVIHVERGIQKPLVSFLQIMSFNSQDPMNVFISYSLVRDRILKRVYEDKLATN